MNFDAVFSNLKIVLAKLQSRFVLEWHLNNSSVL